ncbi:putative cation-transporting ATPase F [Gemmata obscuriglobus]|nr:HAD-IC family P-type ATPase [Gemmata obscuriglobus]QEG28000.1 putative cation-transporting ATPase F [Gemmata obscuriglobus]VTS05526.1 metal abc transporter atpase : Putative integral membrane ATPase OS=Streptomyces rimosus subsp. rimosus ATCC 10970 GN=SRIM_40533 PE=3 SV=1: E1-E2_ATPase: Hydrolase: Cation_ATPase_C [Gemmata obscuriglobus UQM 2246]
MTAPPATGLTAIEVAERVRRGEVNRTRRSAWADYGVIVSRHAFTVFNLVVAPTAVALFSFGDWRAGVSVTGTALANTLIGLAQELRAKRQLDRLAILTAQKARVVRDGRPHEIPVDDVVLGDLVLLRVGETVVADGTLLESQYLEVDEALLTGESDPVRRGAGERVLSGSICVTGEGSYRAEKVGSAAFAQRVTADAQRYSYTTSPITRASNRIITALSIAALALCALYGALYALGEIGAEHMFRMIAATVVSTIPQGLVLTATVAFTIGAVVIGRRGALVQRLNAVEAMAAVDVVCTDKTGTLTSNRLKLDTLRVLTDELPEHEVRHRLAQFACASIDRDNKNIQAIRAALGTVPVEAVEHLPFNARTRFSAARVREPGAERVLVLGAPEALSPGVGRWDAELNRLQTAGLRVLLFAESTAAAPLEPGTLPPALQLLALVALADELRPDAAAVLQALSAQGIAFKAISGDNPRTVQATVAPLNLPMSREPVVSGKDLDAAEDPVAFVRAHSVFGRVEPLQKVAIVEALQKGGANVAMIGDGVNDVLPIKKADLGIAMGEGSPAAKTVSSLVLETNDFAVLPEAIAEGRTIVRNLRRAGKLFLTKNVYSMAFIVAYAVGLFDIPFPYLPQQVTLLNWMVIGVPALLMALTRERSGAADKTPFLADVGGFALRTGLVFAGCGVALLALGKHVWDVNEDTQRTMLLTALILLGVTVLWRVLNGDGERLTTDRWLVKLSLVVVPIYAGFMYWPLSADFFRLAPLSGSEWLKVLAVAAPAFAVSRLAEWIPWRRALGR